MLTNPVLDLINEIDAALDTAKTLSDLAQVLDGRTPDLDAIAMVLAVIGREIAAAQEHMRELTTELHPTPRLSGHSRP